MEFATTSQGTGGYISVAVTLKFDALLKIIVQLHKLATGLFRTTVISN
jgi:hypothetical protein